MGGASSTRKGPATEGGASGRALLGLGIPGVAAGIGLGIGRNRRDITTRAKNSQSEFSILDLANTLSHRFSVLSGLSFISFVNVPPPEVSKRPWSKYSRKRWSPSTLQNEYAQCKTVWPVAQTEALFLPEFPVGLEQKLKLIFLGEISRGAFGQVFHVKCATTSKEFAMKILSKSQVCSLDAVSQVKQEVMIQHVCCHNPFITPLIHFWQTRKLLIVMTEYVGYGELQQLWRSLGRLPEDLLCVYVAEIALAIDFLHNAGVIYRDLKMENILLDSQGHIKLIDFGLSRWLTYGGKTRTICGTLQFMAPEILKGEEYGHSVDWWSLGILTYSLLLGHYPVTGFDDHVSMAEAVDKFPYDPPEKASSGMKSLLCGLLQRSPSIRIHALHMIQKEEIFRHMEFDDIRDRKISPRSVLENYIENESKPHFESFSGCASTPKKSPSCSASVAREPTQGASLLLADGRSAIQKGTSRIGPWDKSRRSLSSPLLGSPLLHPRHLGHHPTNQTVTGYTGGAVPLLQSPLLRLARGQEPLSNKTPRRRAVSAASLPTAVSPLLVNVSGSNRRPKWGRIDRPPKSRSRTPIKDLVNGRSVSDECVKEEVCKSNESAHSVDMNSKKSWLVNGSVVQDFSELNDSFDEFPWASDRIVS